MKRADRKLLRPRDVGLTQFIDRPLEVVLEDCPRVVSKYHVGWTEVPSRCCHTSPVCPSIADATTLRACTSKPTLVRSVNTWGLPIYVALRPGRLPDRNPRSMRSEAPGQHPHSV